MAIPYDQWLREPWVDSSPAPDPKFETLFRWQRKNYIQENYGWDAGKFCFNTEMAITELWPLFNTVRVPLQSQQGFYADLIAIAHRAENGPQLFEMLAKQREDRIKELLEIPEHIKNDKPVPSAMLGARGMLRRGSLDSIVFFLGGFLHGWVFTPDGLDEESGWVKGTALPWKRERQPPAATTSQDAPEIDWKHDPYVLRYLTLKFGLSASTILKSLWPRFNTIEIPIQGEKAFFQDLCCISYISKDRHDLLTRLADKQEARLRELLGVLVEGGNDVLAPDALGTTLPYTQPWATELQRLARCKSFDGLLQFLFGFRYGWGASNTCEEMTKATSTDSNSNSNISSGSRSKSDMVKQMRQDNTSYSDLLDANNPSDTPHSDQTAKRDSSTSAPSSPPNATDTQEQDEDGLGSPATLTTPHTPQTPTLSQEDAECRAAGEGSGWRRKRSPDDEPRNGYCNHSDADGRDNNNSSSSSSNHAFPKGAEDSSPRKKRPRRSATLDAFTPTPPRTHPNECRSTPSPDSTYKRKREADEEEDHHNGRGGDDDAYSRDAIEGNAARHKRARPSSG